MEFDKRSGASRELSADKTQAMWEKFYGSIVSDSPAGDDSIFAELVRKTAFKHTWHNSVRIVLERGMIKPGDQVLDAGCGWGRILMGLLEACDDVSFTAMDLIEDSIKQGQNLFGLGKGTNAIEWKQGNLEALPFESNRFDLVYSSRVFQHLDDPLKGASEVFRVLKPGGRFVIFHQNKWCPVNVRYYSRIFSPPEISSWYDAAGFSDFRVRSMDFFPGIEFLPLGFRMGAEGFLESIPGLNYFGGKVLAWGKKT